jgi:hypothetical protein
MSAIEEVFGVPAGHTLRLVRAARRGSDMWEREHEERDDNGRLVAVFESWSRGAAPPEAGQDGSAGGFVKYSPSGWVLRCSGADARRRTRAGPEEAPSLASQPPSVRWKMVR